MLLEEGAALTFGHAAPYAELDTIVECIGTAFHDDGAVSADNGGFALGGAADEKLVRIGLSAARLGNPSDAGLGFFTLDYTIDWRSSDCPARRGPCS
ncbi:MAG: hypothetical protein QOH54_3727 [Mycobacterium sp.]|nr:hypothetical protein [Mycobacterium sp.]